MEQNGPKKGPNGDKKGHIGQNLFKDVDILGIVFFLEKTTALLIVAILRMITILVMVTILRDGDHPKGW